MTQSKCSLSLNEELLQNISLTTVDLDMIKKSDSDLTQKDFYLAFWFYWDWNKISTSMTELDATHLALLIAFKPHFCAFMCLIS